MFDEMPTRGNKKKKKRWKKLSKTVGTGSCFELNGATGLVKVGANRKDENTNIHSPHMLERKMSHRGYSTEPKKTDIKMFLNTHQVFDKLINKRMRKKKKKKNKKIWFQRQKKRNRGKRRPREEKLGAEVNRDTHLMVVEKPWKCQGLRKRKSMKCGKFRRWKFKPGNKDQLNLQYNVKRDFKTQSMREMKGCKRVMCCCVGFDKLLLWRIQVKKKQAQTGNQLDCYQVLDDRLLSRIKIITRKETFSKK